MKMLLLLIFLIGCDEDGGDYPDGGMMEHFPRNLCCECACINVESGRQCGENRDVTALLYPDDWYGERHRFDLESTCVDVCDVVCNEDRFFDCIPNGTHEDLVRTC